MGTQARPLAVITGASSGIGLELAKCCAGNGFHLVVVADGPDIHEAAAQLRGSDVSVDAVQADLGTQAGVDRLQQALAGRTVDALLANAGRGLGHAFLDQDFEEIERVIDTNVTGTVDLIHRVGREMRARGRGRILITGSIAGFMPGSFQAVYNGTKAFVDSFAAALRDELRDSGVTVTCLMPGPTETPFFRKARLLDTKVGTQQKQAASEVAEAGFGAMMRGEADVVTGWKNKLQAVISHVAPSGVLANLHRKLAEPGTGKH